MDGGLSVFFKESLIEALNLDNESLPTVVTRNSIYALHTRSSNKKDSGGQKKLKVTLTIMAELEIEIRPASKERHNFSRQGWAGRVKNS